MRKELNDQKLIFQPNRYGFGYEIWTSLVNAKESYGGQIEVATQVERIWYTSSKKQYLYLLESFTNKKIGVSNLMDLEVFEDFEPMNLVMEEKHGTFNALITSEEGYFEAIVKLTKERHKQGWYNNDLDYLRQEITNYDNFTDEEIAALPKSLQMGAVRQVSKYKELAREIEKAEKQNELLVGALKGDGPTAHKFLQSMNGHDYNRVSLEKFAGIY